MNCDTNDLDLKPMQEPEVSLRIAMDYIQERKTCSNIAVSIDGAHIKTKNTIHFDITRFMCENGYVKCDGLNDRWQGEYKNPNYTYGIVVSSKPGVGDLVIALNDGSVLFVESKKIKDGSGGEYPAMREAIGQLMTSCPDSPNVIPVVAVPHSSKSLDLARRWSCNERIRRAGIHFLLVNCEGVSSQAKYTKIRHKVYHFFGFSKSCFATKYTRLTI